MINTKDLAMVVTMMSKLNDQDLETVLATVSAMNTSGKKSKGTKPVASVETKDFDLAPIVGKTKYEDEAVTVTKYDKQWRIYLHVPSYWGRRKGRSLQEAKEARDKIKYAIKMDFKRYGATWAGDYKTHNFFWVFPDKKSAKAYIENRKAYNK